MVGAIWGSYIYHGDYDVLSFALLLQGGLLVPAYYHAAQAMEKYLKALALSIADPVGETHPIPQHKRWLKGHSLTDLADRCKVRFPYYGEAGAQAALGRFSEFDKAARYPWERQTLGNGFAGADIPLICELLVHMRADIPITFDDYPLGIFVRGHHHNRPECPVNPHLAALQAPAIDAARKMIPNINKMVRW
jgi:HEPN domain-containing protein